MISFRGVIALVGGFLIYFTFGNLHAFGNISPYITSYIHVYGENSNITASDIIWVYSVAVAIEGIFMSFGGLIENHFNPRITSYIGTFLASIGVIFSYYTIKTSFPLLILTYGFLYGLGIGIAYTSPLIAGMKWFPNNKGLVNGIICGGLGAGNAIFNLIHTSYLNPNNSRINEQGYFTDLEIINKVPSLFLLLGIIVVTMQFIGSTMLSVPEDINEKRRLKDGNNKDVKNPLFPPEIEDETLLHQSYTPKQMLHHYQFYILWFTCVCNDLVTTFIAAMYKSIGAMFIKDDQFLAAVGTGSAVWNVAGIVVWGLLVDRFNYKVCMLGVTASVCIFMATLPLTQFGGKFMFAVWVWMISFTSSGNSTLLPTCITQMFGIAYAGVNYGLIYASTVISSLFTAVLTQNLTLLIGADGVVVMFSGFSFISLLLTLFFKELQE